MAAINLPRDIRIGGGVLAELPAVLAQAGLSRPLIVTDAWIEGSGVLQQVLDLLDLRGLQRGPLPVSSPIPLSN